jgi:hypothetical protein
VKKYGHGRTIHGSKLVEVEVHDGKVVSVWFRCLALPFEQSEASKERADEMAYMYERDRIEIHGIDYERKDEL